MPTKTMEVMRLPDQGNKMVLDSVLTTHERVVQVGTLGDPQVLLLLWFPFSIFFSICQTFFRLFFLPLNNGVLYGWVLDSSTSPVMKSHSFPKHHYITIPLDAHTQIHIPLICWPDFKYSRPGCLVDFCGCSTMYSLSSLYGK